MSSNKGRIPWNKGKIGVISDETRKKLSDSHKGQVSGNKGKTPSEEAKRKMSESHKGQIAWNKGIPQSDEAKIKNSEAHKGKRMSSETEFKEGIIPWNKDKKGVQKAWNKGLEGCYSKDTIYKMSSVKQGKRISPETEFKNGDVPWNKDKKGIMPIPWNKSRVGVMPEAWNKGIPCSEETKQKLSIAMQGEKHPFWRGGISFEPYCHKFNEQLKEDIRSRDNRTCQLCGTIENGKKLSVHHIHYDKKNCEPDLIALCFKCNAKVNFNRDYWETFFMNKLKERGLLTE